MSATLAVDRRLVARPPAIALALLAFAAAVALAIRLLAAGSTRATLGFTFDGVPDRVGEVAAILANNLRLLASVLVLAGIAQAARGSCDRPTRIALATADALVCALAAAHAALVGVGVGAYGGRMIAGLLPHGPFELGAFSLALAFYAAARHGERLGARRWLRVAGASGGLLVIGALAEVYAGGLR